ncbi:MAG: AMP-binding protein, partial [Myxococcota bacterium]|nr:AMP-binding protein [Myxococcota bacterium]
MQIREHTSIGTLFRSRVRASDTADAYRVKSNGRWVSVNWRRMGADVTFTAAGLAQLGVNRGDGVAILGPTCPEWCQVDLAAMLLGAPVVGIYPTLPTDQVRYLLEDARCRVLAVHGAEDFERCRPLLEQVAGLEHLVVWGHPPGPAENAVSLTALSERGRKTLKDDVGLVNDRLAQVSRQDVALVLYSSGTTGQPKGVPLTHHNLLSLLEIDDPMFDLPGPDDLSLSFLPMAHVAEHVVGFLARLRSGMPTAFATSYDTLLDELQEVRPTYFGSVPRIFEKLYGRIHEQVARASPTRQALFARARELALRRARAEHGGPHLGLRDHLALAAYDRLV